jgi:hypothetical protein
LIRNADFSGGILDGYPSMQQKINSRSSAFRIFLSAVFQILNKIIREKKPSRVDRG